MLFRRFCTALGVAGLCVLVASGSATRASATGASAAVPTFRVNYTNEGGYHEVYVWSPLGAGLSGEASLSSQDYDGRTVRRLLVCDRSADGLTVTALVTAADGRELVYPAPVPTGASRSCFSRDLGYAITGWRLRVGAGVSGRVIPPPLV